jgi:hypothetical protein
MMDDLRALSEKKRHKTKKKKEKMARVKEDAPEAREHAQRAEQPPALHAALVAEDLHRKRLRGRREAGATRGEHGRGNEAPCGRLRALERARGGHREQGGTRHEQVEGWCMLWCRGRWC